MGIGSPFGLHTLRTSPSKRCDVCFSSAGLGVFFLGPTVYATLCVVHRDINYLRRFDGDALVTALTKAWSEGGELTKRRQRALANHRTRVRTTVSARHRPGSYSWPLLRLHAESLFQHGVSLRAAFDALRDLYNESLATFPSFSTMRRWFTDARWLKEPKRWKRRYALRGVINPRGPRPSSRRRAFIDVLLQRFDDPALPKPPPDF